MSDFGERNAEEGLNNLGNKVDAYLNIERGNDSKYWDRLARPFSDFKRLSDYARDFLDLAKIREGESVLDMGCGSGTLCIPLSDRGNSVFAADFSEKMLESTRHVIEEEGIGNIKLVNCAWEDDWDSVPVPVCDVAVASRSLMGSGIPECVRKLDAHAKRRVCMTVSASPTMFHNMSLEKFLGREVSPKLGDLEAAVRTGLELERFVEVSYIRSIRIDVYDTPQLVAEHLKRKLGGLRDGEQERFEEYCDKHIIEYRWRDGEANGWCCDEDRESAWAFVSWDKEPYAEARLEVRHH
ncbi:MAG: class I SAM-dependent methyltransferase [Coriobacteriales bacterium]